MEKVTIPPKPKKPPADCFQVCVRVPATGKNATTHRNIVCSGISETFTRSARTQIAGAFADSSENGTEIVTTSFPNVSAHKHNN
jgi:hypothetical protein